MVFNYCKHATSNFVLNSLFSCQLLLKHSYHRQKNSFVGMHFLLIRMLKFVYNSYIGYFLQLCCGGGQRHWPCSSQSCWNEVYCNKERVTYSVPTKIVYSMKND